MIFIKYIYIRYGNYYFDAAESNLLKWMRIIILQISPVKRMSTILMQKIFKYANFLSAKCINGTVDRKKLLLHNRIFKFDFI